MTSSLRLSSIIILSTVFAAFPFFYLNLTSDPTENSKLLLLVVISLILIFIESLKIALSKKFSLQVTTFLIPLFFITAIYLLSSFIKSPNIILPFTSPSATSTWLFLFLFYLTLSTQSQPFKQSLLRFTYFGSGVVAVYIILMYLGLFPKNVTTPAGNLVSTAVFFLAVLVHLVINLAGKFLNKKHSFINYSVKNIFPIITLILISVSSVFLGFHLVSDQKPITLPYGIALHIFRQIAKDPANLLLGVGPANFISAFTLEKPLSLNQTPLWNIIFTSSSSFFTNLIIETGIITGIAYLSIICLSLYLFVRTVISNDKENFPNFFSLIILSLTLIFFPSSTLLLFFFVSLLALTAAQTYTGSVNLKKFGFFIYLLPLFSFFLLLAVSYLSIRAYLADYYYYKAFSSVRNRDLSSAYNLQKEAVSLNPYLDKYHLAVSQTSLLLADELLRQDKTEENNQKIPRLISQSIEEARTAVNLNKANILAWDNLTKIYYTLVNFAPGAQNWAVEIANQTISLDPNNPNHYLTLANIYQKLDQQDKVQEYLNKALTLKPDLNLPANIKLRPISPDIEQSP